MDFEALDAALRAALGEDMVGISWGIDHDGNELRVHVVAFPDTATTDAANAVIAAHDPVLLQADKTSITPYGDGAPESADRATITVWAPREDAAPVVLMVEGQEVALDTSVDGTDTVEIISQGSGVIDISVKNPTNRCSRTLSIVAV